MTRKAFTVAISTIALAIGLTTGLTLPAAAATYNANCTASRLQIGDTGSCVTQLQQLLHAKGTFNGAYTTTFANLTQAGVLQIQRQAGISADGIVGPVTWGVLTKPGSTVGGSNTGSTTTNSLPAACQTSAAKSICIVKGSSSRATLYAVQSGKVIKAMDARTGDSRGSAYATTNGRFSVYWKDVDHISNEFKGAPMPDSLFFNGGEAIHYSADFLKCGYSTTCGAGGASHGCVNLRDGAGADWLYSWTPYNAPVTVAR